MYDALYKKEALKAAKELDYGKKIIDKINKTNDNDKIAQIMLTARQKKFKMEV